MVYIITKDSSSEAVSQRAELSRTTGRWGSLALLLCGTLFQVRCGSPEAHLVPSYDPQSRRLTRLDADLTGDGVIDQRTYLDRNLPFRTEIDRDQDGRVERWEYFNGGALVMVGTSSAGDGVEDTWTSAPDASGERRVDLSRRRDRSIDRREFYRVESLLRADEDSNADGVADKWETYEAGALVTVAFDTTRSAGRPDRRLHYNAKGVFLFIDVDPDGDGRWDRATGAPAPNLPKEH